MRGERASPGHAGGRDRIRPAMEPGAAPGVPPRAGDASAPLPVKIYGRSRESEQREGGRSRRRDHPGLDPAACHRPGSTMTPSIPPVASPNCHSHITQGARGLARGRTSPAKGRSPGFAPRFWWGARVSPRPLVLSGPGDGRVAGTGLGQDMCGQLDGEGEQAVPLAAAPKPAGIIYGADFLQVVLQGWGGRGRPRHWGKGVPFGHPTTQESRASQGVRRWYRSDLEDVF
ncbi:uncharacterized protein LOC128154825 isoform X1 [Harpia harpyja]|uniref:uncharacterized protein LOC128154825 isoform X1 n=1 Tax=Harpia harpyja TaxID=202280 RepID=UPI0022B17EAC|nr:uncharacterized protein LOC128154825 isoform X1 [Harpia harpyja]